MSINIAIDGPAGAGKSTIAKKLAKELNYIYVDTGAMYRAMALYMIEKDVDVTKEDAVSDACKNIEIKIDYDENGQQVILNGRNVNDFIRTVEVSRMSSQISAMPVVREKLLSLQRSLAENANVIMDGRDIGTNVLPNADVKIFLTASVEVRAKRRFDELRAKGETCALDEIAKDISERDERDYNRSIAPLRQADDAQLVDTSSMSIEEVIAVLRYLVENSTGGEK